MQPYPRDQNDRPQAFPAEEYATRLDRLRAALGAAGPDAIYVTVPVDLTWLTGYDLIWSHLRNLTGLLVRAASAETVFFDHSVHMTIVSTTPEIRDVVWLEPGPAKGAIEAVIAESMMKAGGGYPGIRTITIRHHTECGTATTAHNARSRRGDPVTRPPSPDRTPSRTRPRFG